MFYLLDFICLRYIMTIDRNFKLHSNNIHFLHMKAKL